METYQMIDCFYNKIYTKKDKTKNTFRIHEKQNSIEKKNLNISRKKTCRLVTLKIRRNSRSKTVDYLLF